jgi:hypothetical protein
MSVPSEDRGADGRGRAAGAGPQLARDHLFEHQSERTVRAGTAVKSARRTGSQGVSAVLGTGWVTSAKCSLNARARRVDGVEQEGSAL